MTNHTTLRYYKKTASVKVLCGNITVIEDHISPAGSGDPPPPQTMYITTQHDRQTKVVFIFISLHFYCFIFDSHAQAM